MTTHTPGPWIAKSRTVYASDGFAIVASCTEKQDARLIAAAPALLDALTMILPLAEAYLSHAPSHPDNAKLETARMALRAVEG